VNTRRLVVAVLALGVLLRLVGALVNREANDDHLSVIRVIAHEGRFPEPDELWESFQPPLYHVVVAAVLTAVGPLRPDREIVVAQLVSCAAGLATLALLARFLLRLPVGATASSLAVALAALSPALVSTSIQATNDAFVILWGTVALLAGSAFLHLPTARAGCALGLALVLAGLTKGNGLVTIVAAVATLGVAAFPATPHRRRLLAGLAAVVVVVAATVPTFGGYLARRARMGSALATNMPVSPPPDFLRETNDKRPGILSIASGFLTFPLASMLDDPLIERPDDSGYPRHRTSFWSLVYGTTHSVHYAYFPPTWRIGPERAAHLVRVGLLAALVPTLLMAMGLARMAMRAVTGLRAASRGRYDWVPVLLLLAVAGHVIFAAAYGYRHRDFSTMKGIFLAPAACAVLAAIALALDELRTCSGLGTAAVAATALLCLSYGVDVGMLLWQLSRP
jgi:hypothetical protein